ncbi:MAG TPA: hypothetical protein VH157_08370 [Bryobacteraceae bacterium]|nr:hypothetical protein [Bryobacteraceae bacterium]
MKTSSLQVQSTTKKRPRASAAQSLGTCAGEGVYFIDGFLSKDECGLILEELDSVFWHPSLTYRQQPDGKYQNQLTSFRVSQTAHQEWFGEKLLAILAGIETRLQKLFRAKPSNLEQWQATDYCRHGMFDYHLDSGYWQDHYAGERILTFLLHLRTPLKGGGTDFRALDTYIDGRAGRLVVWENLFPNGDCNYKMMHSSTPLLKGKKTTLVTWLRQKKYRNVDTALLGGKR